MHTSNFSTITIVIGQKLSLNHNKTMSKLTILDVLHSMFWVINPYQESDGVVATLIGSKLKCPEDMESVHPGLHYFYHLLKPKMFGPLIDVVLFWFGHSHQYCALGIGPFGHVPNHEEEIKHFHEYTKCIQVPDSWTHLINVNK